jgi:hypothetical protein
LKKRAWIVCRPAPRLNLSRRVTLIEKRILKEKDFMEEVEIGEVGVDKVGDEAREHAKERGVHVGWMRWLALSTAVFAVLAAIASLESGKLANDSLLRMNESTLKQAQAADEWAYYQAKGIKEVTREAEAEILTASHSPAEAITQSRSDAARYKTEQDAIQEKARHLEEEQKDLQEKSRAALERHHTFAYVVTLLQVAIGLSAIAALAERRGVWLLALLAGAVGIVFMVTGFLHAL